MGFNWDDLIVNIVNDLFWLRPLRPRTTMDEFYKARFSSESKGAIKIVSYYIIHGDIISSIILNFWP